MGYQSVVTFLMAGVLTVAAQGPQAAMKKTNFGKLADGRAVDLYTLTNRRGMRVEITNYGGTVISIQVPDRQGKVGEVALGYDTLAGYLGGTYYFGATIGRYGNRIAQGKFSLDGKTYTLAKNNGENSLHGGLKGFDKVLWNAQDVSTATAPGLQLTYLSRDGEEGFPGNLNVAVVFTMTEDNGLRIAYTATTDRDTVVNLTNHTYFNLTGRGQGDILQHELKIAARRYTPVDATLIPTGELKAVAGTPFDFTQLTAVGARINATDPQLTYGKGYDHNFVLDAGVAGMAQAAAELYDPVSGREMQIFTTEPGLQFYSGNYLAQVHAGLALETQHFPDSPNHPQFPTTELRPGGKYQTTTEYRFSAH